MQIWIDDMGDEQIYIYKCDIIMITQRCSENYLNVSSDAPKTLTVVTSVV